MQAFICLDKKIQLTMGWSSIFLTKTRPVFEHISPQRFTNSWFQPSMSLLGCPIKSSSIWRWFSHWAFLWLFSLLTSLNLHMLSFSHSGNSDALFCKNGNLNIPENITNPVEYFQWCCWISNNEKSILVLLDPTSKCSFFLCYREILIHPIKNMHWDHTVAVIVV